MGPKPTPSKQGNTLFSYFSKSPSINKSSGSVSDTSEILSPKRSPNLKDKANANSTPKQTAKSSKSNDELVKEYELGDLLWSKLEGYPWWPSLVCNHPTENTHVKGGKNAQVHVQFFDDPVSRSWVKVKNVRSYIGSDDKECQKGGTFFSMNMLVRKAGDEADKAMKMNVEDRLKLVVNLLPSDNEDDEMDFDPDIFDAEMEEGESNNSKENKDIEQSKTTPKKTPKKSPRKGRRSARQPKLKRRRIIESKNSSDEDSGDEFKPGSDSSGEEDDSSGVDENDVSDIDHESEIDSPVKNENRKRKRPPPKQKISDTPSSLTPSANRNSFTPSVGDKTKSRLSMFSASDSGPSVTGSSEQEANFPHVKLPFLQPGKILDIKGHPESDPDYDPRTVSIPDTFLKQQTPGMRQWWEMKSKYYDTILFFKMGKFYELFHMDAVVGVNELGIIYMKGEQAHSGFPEIAYTRYASTLLQKGYKVARIEQTETPDMMNDRLKTMSRMATKFDKVVRREVCRVTTKGTQTFSFLDGDATEAKSNFLLGIAEKEDSSEGCSTYGVCFVDTSIGKFHVGQFTDDRYSSRLRTLIAHYTPVQVLLERGKSSQKTNQLINNNLISVTKEFLAPGSEFWESGKTLKRLAEEDYFSSEDELVWPDTIKKMISDSDSLGLTAADEYNLAVRALGSVTWYLQFCLLDTDLLTMKNFEEYTPLDDNVIKTRSTIFTGKQHMVLDGVTLANLDVTENSSNGTLEGTLLQRLDQCSTPFGRRLLKQWLCAPLCNPESINDRLNGVEDLMESQDIVAEVVEMMKKIPDLERILNRIHSLGLSKKKNHPDSRAIFFDEAKYSKKKIEEFLSTLEGFKTSYNIALKFKERVKSFKSKLLQKTLTLVSVQGQNGVFPDLKDEIVFFENAFDHNKAKKDGVIVPNKGVDPDYDKAKLDIKMTERKFDKYLDEQRDRISCRQMVFWGSGKNRYQLEIPESALKRVPDEYDLKSSKKGWKRYWTSDIQDMLAELVEAEDRKDVAQRDCMRRIFESFDERYKIWDTTVQCVAVLDVLVAMAQYSRCGDGIMCRPEVIAIESNREPYIEIREARHPCVVRTFGGGDFIPNDTIIGIADENDMETDAEDHSSSKVVLVTGPNMGGKSTLMRQVGLITIIAQMGCYVPAEKCRMTPVDRVFTRLGASDRIMAGESTFFVELSETAAILQHATKHSLVLMDELGRGTATYDGTAIACSVVQELSRNIACRTLFSTHYHSLVEEFSHDPNIRLGHMSCMVENEDKDPTHETITFLYKFTKGACPKSYGFNAAKLANIPDEIIRIAVKKSREFEESIERLRMIRSVWNNGKKESLILLQNQSRVS
ncbi:DNA mismatch repair protein Msh6-like [Mytilus californianus]|uniref:DNA mismatch repair protein Msh6-like n=1 Tax=Mytilus californianus TaxID=6549 RepID=UPI002245872C|nr:DNA mismatch repair protein Msh6-like [Mytilus californianus]